MAPGQLEPQALLDAQAPSVLLLDASRRVVGLEWEGRNTGQPPVLFGQAAVLLPGHPGPPEVNVPHYTLHAYLRPNGTVLFDVFDPELRCPDPSQRAPAAAPTQLPRTGGTPAGSPLVLGAAILGLGAVLRRHAALSASTSSRGFRSGPRMSLEPLEPRRLG